MAQAVSTTVFVADDSGFSTNNIALGVDDIDLRGDLEYAVSTGKRGTRQPYECRSRIVAERILGGFSIKPTDTEIDWIVERMIGDNITGYPAGSASPGETLPQWHIWVDKGGEQTFLYSPVLFGSVTISGAELAELIWRCELVGTAETQPSDLTPVPLVDCDNQFIFSDCELTIGGTAYSIKSFDLTIDNQFGDGQYENNTQRSIFESEGIAVGLDIVAAYRSDTKALYRRGIAGDDNCTLEITDGTNTYTFTFGNLKAPATGPTVPSVGEITQSLSFQAFRTTSAPILSIAKS